MVVAPVNEFLGEKFFFVAAAAAVPKAFSSLTARSPKNEKSFYFIKS